MRIVFIGCVEFSRRLLSKLLTFEDADVVGVVTREEAPFNSDFCSLEPMALERTIPCLNVEGGKQDEMAEWIACRRPDVVFCLGWSYLLNKEILSIPPLGVVGYHPTMLPLNRGRHPIIWALALGLKETGSTFFIMDEGADSGDIINQERVIVDYGDDAASLYEKLLVVAQRQLVEIVHKMIAGNLDRQPQNHAIATSWRKRTKRDGEIDWRMSAKNIYNLVRALTRPYPGAHCIYRGKEIKVWKSAVRKNEEQAIEPGTVLETLGNTITVKCGSDAAILLEHEFSPLPEVGEYI